MSGKPGRSGKARTPEERQAKRRFAKMGGNAAAGRKPAKVKRPVFTKSKSRPVGSVDHTPALLAAFPELADYPFPVPDSLALKDALEAALKQAKANQAEVELDEAKVKRDLSRGALKTKVEFRESVTSIVEEIVTRLSILVDAAVETHPPEHQPRVRHLMEAAAYKLRDDVRAHLKEQTA
jgi:hypothetical protein